MASYSWCHIAYRWSDSNLWREEEFDLNRYIFTRHDVTGEFRATC